VFITQLAARAQEKMLLAKALQSISKSATYDTIIKGAKRLRQNTQGQ
jgi:hypothetical protein